MKIRNPFKPAPLERYLSRDNDPHLQGQPGRFTGTLTVVVREDGPLAAQRLLEEIADELLALYAVDFAMLTSIARSDEEVGGDDAQPAAAV